MGNRQQAVRYTVCGLLLAFPAGCSTPAKNETVLLQGEGSPKQQPKTAPSQLANDAVKEPPAPRDTQPVPMDEAASVPVVPGSLRLVLIADHELLKSEARRFAALKKEVEKLGDMVHEATLDEEKAYLEATENANAPTLPARWQPVEKIVLIQLRAPVVYHGTRSTGGLKSLMVVMPPLNIPVYKDESSFEPKQIAAVVDALSVAKEAKQ